MLSVHIVQESLKGKLGQLKKNSFIYDDAKNGDLNITKVKLTLSLWSNFNRI